MLLAGVALARPAAAAIAVSGRVLAPRDAPLPGAQVALLPYPDRYRADLVRLGLAPPERPAATDRADDQGAFRLLAPSDGMWRVEASAPGRVAMVHRLPGLVDNKDLEPVELPPDAGLSVTVTDAAGRPAAGAWVTGKPAHVATADASGWLLAERVGTADADGRIVLARSPEDGLVVTA